MPFVRFPAPYLDAITGRDVESAVHHEDDSGGGVAWVETAREGDEVIDEATYQSERGEIAAYNAALPRVEEPSPPDVGGFLLSLYADVEHGGLGEDRAIELASKRPDFTLALDRGRYDLARGIVEKIPARGVITEQEYDAIQAAFAAFGIPEA